MLTLERNRDLAGRGRHPWVRRILLGLLAVLLLLALLNVFGQRPETLVVENRTARLELYAPARLRGGLIFPARFTIEARREIKQATLVLDPGWLEGTTLNSVEPAPLRETSRDGRLALDLGRIGAGRTFVLFLHFQVNPTNVGRRDADVALEDGNRRLLAIDRTITIWP